MGVRPEGCGLECVNDFNGGQRSEIYEGAQSLFNWIGRSSSVVGKGKSHLPWLSKSCASLRRDPGFLLEWDWHPCRLGTPDFSVALGLELNSARATAALAGMGHTTCKIGR